MAMKPQKLNIANIINKNINTGTRTKKKNIPKAKPIIKPSVFVKKLKMFIFILYQIF
jgi:hypothetical protein